MKALWRELRDRHVVRVAVAYLVGSWLVLQLADVIFPALGLPDWSITLALALLVVGFPVVLVLAWIFDLTPRGIVRTDSVGDGRSDITTQGLAGNSHERTQAARNSATLSDHSIAVLPLTDMSAERDQEHFCDGLTDELLNVLTCIPNLRVASRTSSFAFKGRAIDIGTIAEKLRVAYVLEGSVRKDGNKVRITVQLVEVANDSHLWSENYDRELSDIFAIQDDIAARILEALKLKLGAVRLPEVTTQNPKAYEYYLRGRGYFLTKTNRDLARAIDMLRKATAVDPGFVRAWINLAEVSAIHTLFVRGGPASVQTATQASERAMELAPNRADSYLARGFANLAAQQFVEAEQDFARALELDSRQVVAWHYLARAALHQGKLDAAREYFTRATELNPEDWESPLIALGSYQAAGDLDGARRMAQIGVERAARHLEDYPDNPRPYYLSLSGLRLLGEHERARRYADKALAIAPDDSPTRYNLACFYAQIGETDKALDLLEGSIGSRSWIENDPDLDSVRDHPRYRAVIETLPD